MVLLCKLEEELGFKSEQQLRESVELQGEQLSKMDEKLIQLFEVLYILETAETNFQDELHLVATEGAAVFTNSRVLSTVSRVTLCSEEGFKTQRRFSEPKRVFRNQSSFLKPKGVFRKPKEYSKPKIVSQDPKEFFETQISFLKLKRGF